MCIIDLDGYFSYFTLVLYGTNGERYLCKTADDREFKKEFIDL